MKSTKTHHEPSSMHYNFRKTLPDIAAIFLSIIIIVFSLMSSSSGYVKTAFHLFGSDTLGHFFAYLCLGLCALFRRNSFKSALTAASVVIIFGGVIEVIQAWFVRGPELQDLFANTLGVVSAWLIVITIRSVRSATL